MILTLTMTLGLVSALYVVARLLSGSQIQARKREYQRFLQEDRMNSTLEYSRDVTRQRRDTRVWR
ncbi:MAG: hypothetical protein KGL57_00800 [Burkholderiales bacterium]|nr:hypothetical protein [Burkholderiales bacterium]